MRVFNSRALRRERAARARAEERATAAEAVIQVMAGGGDGIPAALLSAAGSACPDGQAVKVTIGGQEVIAVVGPGGSPAEWYAAISQGVGDRKAS